MSHTSTNGWNKYQKLVLFRLDAQDELLKSLETKMNSLQNSVTILKVKVGLIGAICGSLGGSLGYYLVHVLLK